MGHYLTTTNAIAGKGELKNMEKSLFFFTFAWFYDIACV